MFFLNTTDYSICWGNTTDTLSPGHTVLWLPPHFIQAYPILHTIQAMSCWHSSWSFPLNLPSFLRFHHLTFLFLSISRVIFPIVLCNSPVYIHIGKHEWCNAHGSYRMEIVLFIKSGLGNSRDHYQTTNLACCFVIYFYGTFLYQTSSLQQVTLLALRKPGLSTGHY